MQTILITGGAGFIGSHIQDACLQAGYQVCVIDDLSTGFIDNVHDKAELLQVDIQNAEEVEQIFQDKKIDVVCHHAAQINVRHSVQDPQNDAEINVLGSLNILEASRKHDVKKVVFASTGGALYGDTSNVPTSEEQILNPYSPYGISKLSVEKYLHYYYREYGLKYGILRYSNVYGPRQNEKSEAGVVSIFINKMLRNENPIIFGTGEQTRDYVFVEDIVKANMMLMQNIDACDVFNVGTGKETNVNQLFDIINSHFGDRFLKKYSDALQGEQLRSALDYSKIQKTLHWKPEITLNEGIEKTWNFFKGII